MKVGFFKVLKLVNRGLLALHIHEKRYDGLADYILDPTISTSSYTNLNPTTLDYQNPQNSL